MMTTRWGAVFALWFAGLCGAAQFAKIGLVFEELKPLWPDAGAGLGLMVSIVGFMGILFGSTAGLFVARLGPRRTIVTALLVAGVLSLVQSVGLPLGWMLATRVAEGLCHLAIVVVGPVLIAANCAPKDQAAGMTLWSSFFAVAFTVIALLGLPLVYQHGVALLWQCHAGACLLAGGLLWKVLPVGQTLRASGRVGFVQLLRDHVAIYASPYTAAPATGFIFYTFIFVAIMTLVPAQIPSGHRAFVASAMPLFSIAASMGIGVQLMRVMAAVRVVQLGFAIAATGAVLWFFATGLWGIAAALMMAAALGLVQSASFAAIPQLNAEAQDRARAAGAIAQLGNIGTTLGTPVLLLVTQAYGSHGISYFVLPLCIGGIAMHSFQSARRP
ncbi:MFS transporter [Rhodobacteraceae bacterium]|nr:MFS transporter [Paracoccaceae bacterium]